MIEVNTVALKQEVERLNKLLSEYEEIQLNLFHQLRDSCTNWQDGISLKFNQKVIADQKESNMLLQTIEEYKNVYQYIAVQYEAFGKKVKCDLDNRQSILSAIDQCSAETNNIISSLNAAGSTNISYIYQVLEQLQSLRQNVVEIYRKIESIEHNINDKLKELAVINISEFTFENL